MKQRYHDCVYGMWGKHSVDPLRAGEIALYCYLAHKAHENNWQMPMHIAGGLIVLMLFSKSSLEAARKRLVSLGLIECTVPRGNTFTPSYRIKDSSGKSSPNGKKKGNASVSTPRPETDAKNTDVFVDAANLLWAEFEEEAFDAKTIALYFFLLNIAEKKQWAMPFRCFDAEIVPSIMQTNALREARKELIKRGLITFDEGNPKKSAPKYTIVLGNVPVTDSAKTKTVAETESKHKTVLRGTEGMPSYPDEYLEGFGSKSSYKKSMN